MKPTLISALDDYQVDQLLALYRGEFWCSDRARAGVEKMLRHTDIVLGAVDDGAKLVGFVRVLTDYVYKATIYDLIVHPDWRGRKLGRMLMDAVLAHPELKDVEHFDLHCLPEMHAFYAKWGFATDMGRLTFMRRVNRRG